jgi:hypothetical protein
MDGRVPRAAALTPERNRLTTLPDALSRHQSDHGGTAAPVWHRGRAVGVERAEVPRWGPGRPPADVRLAGVALGRGAESFGRSVDSPDRVTRVILMTDLEEAASAHSVAAEAGLAQQSR